MRLVPPSIIDAFYSGDMTGDSRNMARVVVQKGLTQLFPLPYNLYASSVFGPIEPPMELPNVRNVKWSRSKGQDFATGTIEFYNTEPLPLGTVLTRDLDQPGYFTYNRGRTQFKTRWGTEENEWSGMLMPDNFIRTYEGYGFDPTVIPELDEHLVSTGLWRIDDVDYQSDGIIVVTVRDIGSILGDEFVFPPVVPKNFWPVTFTADDHEVGFIGPSANSTTQRTDDVTQPASWTGPVDGPATTTVTDGDSQITVDWTRPSTADTAGDNTHRGYKVVGYQIAVDGVLLPKVHKASVHSAVLKGPISNGNVYSIGVIALWKEQLNAKAKAHFKTNVEQQVRSNFGPVRITRPNHGGADVVTGSIQINVNELGTLAPDYVTFHYTGTGSYRVIAYKSHSSTQQVFKVDATGSGATHVDTNGKLGDLTEWNFLVHGIDAAGHVGKADVFFAGIDGAYYAPPAAGQSPAPTSVGGAKVKSKTTTKPLKAVDVKLSFDDSSNTYYIGAGPDQSVYGHKGKDAFDSQSGSYWMSIGNDVNSAGYSYEWLQASCKSITLTSVTVKTRGKNYGVYVSVFSDGQWVQHPDTGVIPYNPALPESHNHANIPYAEFKHEGNDEKVTIDLRKPIPNVTKVRVTFHNLQYFGETSPYSYRAAVRSLTAKGQTAPSTSTATVTGATKGKVKAGQTSATTYVPAHIAPGLGANPGLYVDYTDIVKLLCAWGGFYWPPGAQQVLSDGSVNEFDWGVGPYGLPNVDPVLGDVDGGRIWGDLEDTGTAGLVQIPVNVWALKSLMDGISYVRDIIGYIFYVDEDGAVVWRRPNYYAIGNWIGNDAPAGTPVRITNVVTIDEEQTLVGLTAKVSGRNVRERIFVGTTDGKTGALAKGYNPNPTGLRRVTGWTDQHFSTQEECQVMAELIALQQMFTYRTDKVSIFGYPAIQVDDQVLIIEQVTSEGYYHYVTSIDSVNDIEGGGWQYTLGTQWLGEEPFDNWAFTPSDLSEETQTYLDAFDYGTVTTLADGSV